jgi:hypothetical protein
VGNRRNKLIVRPWPHNKVIARVFSKSDLAEYKKMYYFKATLRFVQKVLKQTHFHLTVMNKFLSPRHSLYRMKTEKTSQKRSDLSFNDISLKQFPHLPARVRDLIAELFQHATFHLKRAKRSYD